jgi:hypothetical protein
MLRPENFAAGVILVALGVLWTLSNMGRLDLLATLHTWWPLTLVVWGTGELISWWVGRTADGGPAAPSEPVLPSQLDGTTGRDESTFSE